jgi:hypothetical protein
MAISKPTWLKNAVAKPWGYYSKKGHLLKKANLSKEYCDEWNGTDIESSSSVSTTDSVSITKIQPTINITDEENNNPSILRRFINKFKKG